MKNIYCQSLSIQYKLFVYRMYTKSISIISHHLQNFLDAGMKLYVVQLNFCAASDRVSQDGFLFKLKSIGVSGFVLSICTEFLSDHRQRVDWVDPNCLRHATEKCVGSSSVYCVDTDKLFELVEYLPMWMTPHYWQLFASQQIYLLSLPPLTGTWLGPGVVQSLWMILNPKKIRALVINRSRNVNPPYSDFLPMLTCYLS